MNWLARSLAGPILWAVMFSAVYALHGFGCAVGWQNRPFLSSDLHHTTLWGLWLAGLVAHVMLIKIMPRYDGNKRFLIVAGTWIGFASSLFTLFPIIAVSSCLAG